MLYFTFKNHLMFMAFFLIMGTSEFAVAMDPQQDDNNQTVSRKRPFDASEEKPYPERMRLLLEALANETRENVSWLETRVRDTSPTQRESEINYYFAMKREEGHNYLTHLYLDDFLEASREY